MRSPLIAPVAVNTAAPGRVADRGLEAAGEAVAVHAEVQRTLSVPTEAPADGGACCSRKRKNAV